MYMYILDLQTCNFIKNRLQHRCFPKNIAKFLIIIFNQFSKHLRMAASDILVNSILEKHYMEICDRNNLLVFEYYFCHKFSHNLSEVYCLRFLFSYSSRIHTLYCGCHLRKSCGYHHQ